MEIPPRAGSTYAQYNIASFNQAIAKVSFSLKQKQTKTIPPPKGKTKLQIRRGFSDVPRSAEKEDSAQILEDAGV